MILDSIPTAYQSLLKDKTIAFAFLATLMPDGTPQVTPVWFNTDGEYILINTAQGRVKERNMRARPAVALTLINFDDPEKYIAVRGRVVEQTTEGGLAHIDQLAHKYRGKAWTPVPGQVRVIFKIKPEKVHAG